MRVHVCTHNVTTAHARPSDMTLHVVRVRVYHVLAVFGGHKRASRPTLSRSPLMRPCTSASSHRHPPLVPATWSFHLRCPMQETGLMEYICRPGPPPPRLGVPPLLEVLAGCSTSQHLLLLPRMPQHSGPFCKSPVWLRGQW